MKDLPVTWAEFDEAVRAIAPHVDRSADWLYGVPRGGLALAVALSHTTGIPLIMEPRREMVLIDDIADSGATIRYFLDQGWRPRQVMTWFRRVGCPVETAFSVRDVEAGLWVVFPWEAGKGCGHAGQ
jgi:hypoxanthine phosphoribosyltransferase